MEVQRGKATCPRSHSQNVPEPGFEPPEAFGLQGQCSNHASNPVPERTNE